MSWVAIKWAYAQQPDCASEKSVLLALSYRASEVNDWCVWSSVKDLSKLTGLNRKTVMAAVAKLQSTGLIVDTKDRRGGTGQIPVYRIAIELTQNRDATNGDERPSGNPACVVGEDETVPFFSRKSPVFSSKESQKWDTEQVMEQVNEQRQKPMRQGRIGLKASDLNWLDQEHWKDYVEYYKSVVKRPVPPAWESKALFILEDLVADGHDQTEILDKAINSEYGLLLRPQIPNGSLVIQRTNPDRRAGEQPGVDGHPQNHSYQYFG